MKMVKQRCLAKSTLLTVKFTCTLNFPLPLETYSQ